MHIQFVVSEPHECDAEGSTRYFYELENLFTLTCVCVRCLARNAAPVYALFN